ncbi:MAG: HD domain-containing protein [Solobacterium sp.]|nr:HD domain-containing protein [Solobacterium sp.]
MLIINNKNTFLDADDETAMEFLKTVADITACEDYQKLKLFTHHRHTTRYQHCLNVAWYSFIWAKKAGLNYKSCARGAMLHDFYLYDPKTGGQPIKGNHIEIHPIVALANAEKYYEVDEVMKDCILHHMWPMNNIRPVTKEGMIVQAADKYCASLEWSIYNVRRIKPVIREAYNRLIH